jgi:hypothetical protein
LLVCSTPCFLVLLQLHLLPLACFEEVGEHARLLEIIAGVVVACRDLVFVQEVSNLLKVTF